MIGVNVPFVLANPKIGELNYDVESFSVLYAGTTGNYPVRCSAVTMPVCPPEMLRSRALRT